MRNVLPYTEVLLINSTLKLVGGGEGGGEGSEGGGEGGGGK